MHILISGAGISGVMAAYFLGRRGHSVEVIDRRPAPARECSFANGGQLSYSHAEPWANPYVFSKVFRWMFRDDAPLVLRFSADARMIAWGLRFLWNCRPAAAHRNSLSLLRLGLYSRTQMQAVVAETGIDFHHTQKGILHVFSKEREFEHARRQAAFQHRHGGEETILSREACLQLEPALRHTQEPICGGIHAPQDESGDMHRFCTELAAFCAREFGVQFHFETEIYGLHVEQHALTHISTSRGDMRADAYVVALGAFAAPMLRRIGIHVPIYPMKGYSISFPATDDMPQLSITDDARKIVYSRLGERIRCAGTAEFAGYNTDLSEKRLAPIRRGIRALFPQADLSQTTEWACLRPSTPDGPPIVGATRYGNLFLNGGHGTLGWTQSAATARLLADNMEGKQTEIPLDGLTMERY